MASILPLLSAVIVSCIGAGHASDEFVTVQCHQKTTGQFGEQSMLDCVIKTSAEVKDPEIVVVVWKKEGVDEPLLMFRDGKTEHSEGYRFAERSWNNKNMNVSLLITNTAVEHEGEYTCRVFTDSGDNYSKTWLRVTAQYSKPTITMYSPQDTPKTLTCSSEGGYPKGQLRWSDHVGTDWTASASFNATAGADGRFGMSSTLTLMPGSTFPKYTCVVFNASGGKQEEVTFEIHPKPTPGLGNHSTWVAPMVVIGSLIVGLLLLLLFLRRRSRRARRQSAAPLMGEHEAVPPSDAERGEE